MTEQNFDSMTKAQLIELINQQKEALDNASKIKPGRKVDVFRAMCYGPASISELAERVSKLTGDSYDTRNVSSQLTYLKKAGLIFHTDHNGRKVLIEPIPAELQAFMPSQEEIAGWDQIDTSVEEIVDWDQVDTSIED